MKRIRIIFLLFAWFICSGKGKKIDPWVVVHIDGNATIKVRNSNYYEYLEMCMLSEKQCRALARKYINDSLKYERWEKIEKEELKDSLGIYNYNKYNINETILF